MRYDDENDNNNSLVLKLQADGQTLLFAGDMEYREEYSLMTANADLDADVLKVGNHGNPDATSAGFASAVSPDIAVISTDTAVDTDSASPAVISALGSALVYITEDYETGVLLEVSKDKTALMAIKPLESPADLRILDIDLSAQTADIGNSGGALDISGFMLRSDKGSELLVFPEGTVISASGTLTVACEGGPGDVIWTGEKKVWNTKEPDTGILYDRWGRELARLTALSSK